MQLIMIVLSIVTWLNNDPFSIMGNEFFGIYDEPIVEWTFNPALLSHNKTSVGFVLSQKSSYGKVSYSSDVINRIDYFDWYQSYEGGGAYYLLSGNRAEFAVRMLAKRYGYYYFYYNYPSITYPVIGSRTDDNSDFANIALSWRITGTTSLGLGLDFIRRDILYKSSYSYSLIKSDSLDLETGIYSMYESRLSKRSNSNKFWIGEVKLGLSSGNIAIHAGVFRLNRRYLKADIYDYIYKNLVEIHDTLRQNVNVTMNSESFRFSHGLDGDMIGFEGGLIFKYRKLKGSICLNRLNDNIPFVVSLDSTWFNYRAVYDTSTSDTSYIKNVVITQVKGKLLESPEYNFRYTRLNVTLGNDFPVKRGLKGIISFSSEYINSKVSGDAIIVSAVTHSYTFIDSSDTGFIHRDTTVVDTIYSHFPETLNSEITYANPEFNIGLIMKFYKNLNIIGILSAGFAYSKTSTGRIEESVTNSSVSLRLGFTFDYKNWEISGKNYGNIFYLGNWTLMISRRL